MANDSRDTPFMLEMTPPGYTRVQSLLLLGTALLIATAYFLARRKASKNGRQKTASHINKKWDPLDFSQVQPYKENFDLSAEIPIPYYRQDYIRDYTYTITMAIRPLAFDDWIAFDNNYVTRMAFKKKVLEEHGIHAIDCRQGGYDGCVELLEYLVEYLPRRFPNLFTVSKDGNTIKNHATGEVLRISEPYDDHHPLYLAGRLIEDDLNVLTEGPDGEYVLKAVLSAFPAGFFIQDKMDKPLSVIHQPVPLYREKLAFSMNKFFRNVTTDKLVMRLNWSINDHEELFLVAGGHLYEDDAEDTAANADIDISQVQLRIERQVPRRLPRTGAVCMLTKTYLYPLADIATEPGFAARLYGLLDKLPTKFAFYKRKPVWGKVVLEYLKEMAEKYPAKEGEI